MNDVTGLAVALTTTARTRAHQLARELQAAQRALNAAGADLTDAKRGYGHAAARYRDLYSQALQVWSLEELGAAGAAPPPPAPTSRTRAEQ